MKRDRALDILCGGLWHTTSEQRFANILEDREIKPEPDLSRLWDGHRFNDAGGPDFYPMARSLGAVSLFDLTDFDADVYSDRYRLCTWTHFIPFVRTNTASVWIEVSRDAVAGALIDRFDLLARWRDGNCRRNIMPEIEAAHVGPIPAAAWVRAFTICADHDQPIAIKLPGSRP